jgi:hypothetical protein
MAPLPTSEESGEGDNDEPGRSSMIFIHMPDFQVFKSALWVSTTKI